MVKKRRSKKRVSRKTSGRVSGRTSSYRRSRRNSGTRTSKRMVHPERKKNIVIKNMFVFGILFIISLGLYYVTSNELFRNFFKMFALVTGFVFVAFVLVYLILFFLRMMRR
ncbi:MAG: hypothetical protein ABIH49_02165 [archaeon]